MIEFTKVGNGEESLVLLHGWAEGISKESYQKLIDFLARDYTVYALDLPGFGGSPLPRVYTLADYAKDVGDFLKVKKIRDAVLVGHSFGGRVAIKLLASDPAACRKLVLIASAGIERKGWKVRLIKTFTPLIPETLRNTLRPLIGSKDYLQTSGLRRQTFINIISEDLESDLSKIRVPTLLIWGRDDHTTPLWQGELMHKLIPNSKLVVIPGDHGIPCRKAKEVAGIIINYLAEIQETGK